MVAATSGISIDNVAPVSQLRLLTAVQVSQFAFRIPDNAARRELSALLNILDAILQAKTFDSAEKATDYGRWWAVTYRFLLDYLEYDETLVLPRLARGPTEGQTRTLESLQKLSKGLKVARAAAVETEAASRLFIQKPSGKLLASLSSLAGALCWAIVRYIENKESILPDMLDELDAACQATTRQEQAKFFAERAPSYVSLALLSSWMSARDHNTWARAQLRTRGARNRGETFRPLSKASSEKSGFLSARFRAASFLSSV